MNPGDTVGGSGRGSRMTISQSIELSHRWHVWHHAQWQQHLRMLVLYRSEQLPSLAAIEAENVEWHVRASRAHNRFAREMRGLV